MGKRVTYEETVAVCEQLVRDGLKATSVNIRNTLNRGSMTTINKFRKKWEEGRSDETVIDGDENMPKEILTLLGAAGRAAWTAAKEQAEEVLRDRENALKKRELHMDSLLKQRDYFEEKYNTLKENESMLANENRSNKAELRNIGALLRKEEQISFGLKMDLKKTHDKCERQAKRIGNLETELKMLRKKSK